MTTYFAGDGSYGNADKLFVADTTQWTLEDWEEIEMAGDSDRLDVAEELTTKYTMETAQ